MSSRKVTKEFVSKLLDWKPNLGFSAIFGQKIPTDVVKYLTNNSDSEYLEIEEEVYEENRDIKESLSKRDDRERFGCFNFHPSTYEWPSKFAGGQFFDSLKKASLDGLNHFCVTMHQVQWNYDSGRIQQRSQPIPLFPEMTAVESYLTCTQSIVEMVREEIKQIEFFRRQGL